MAIVAPKPSSSLEDRMTSISSFDTENVIAPLNANANAGNEELKGYQVAAYIAGIVAATPAKAFCVASVVIPNVFPLPSSLNPYINALVIADVSPLSNCFCAESIENCVFSARLCLLL